MFSFQTIWVHDNYEWSICKLAVLHGARLPKLALHYSRAAEPSDLGTRFPGLSGARTECRPRAQQGLGVRSARGGRWLVPAATDEAAVTVISAGLAAQTAPSYPYIPTPRPKPRPHSLLSLLLHSLSFDPSVCLSFFSLFCCFFTCLPLDFCVSEFAGLRSW